MIVDDSNIIRHRIARIVENAKLQKIIEVAAFAKNGTEAIQLFIITEPGIITMDLTKPEMGDVQCT